MNLFKYTNTYFISIWEIKILSLTQSPLGTMNGSRIAEQWVSPSINKDCVRKREDYGEKIN